MNLKEETRASCFYNCIVIDVSSRHFKIAKTWCQAEISVFITEQGLNHKGMMDNLSSHDVGPHTTVHFYWKERIVLDHVSHLFG